MDVNVVCARRVEQLINQAAFYVNLLPYTTMLSSTMATNVPNTTRVRRMVDGSAFVRKM